jgi:hypothetical protein
MSASGSCITSDTSENQTYEITFSTGWSYYDLSHFISKVKIIKYNFKITSVVFCLQLGGKV